jgi:hypothetical protein
MKNADTPAMPIEINGFGQYAPECHAGLTKREMFAMHAMQGLLSSNATYGGVTTNRKALAADALAHADALLSKLERTK